jgi:Cu(I)/Ag(I) efflux system membrane fusion protein
MPRKTFYLVILALSVLPALPFTASAQEHDHGSQAVKTEKSVKPSAAYPVPEAFKTQMDSVLTAYFAVQSALSRDALAETGKESGAILTALKKVDMHLLQGKAHARWMEQAAIIEKSAKAIMLSGDLKTAREAFHRLSNALILTAHEFNISGPRPVYVLHCPMAFNNKGADWLQYTKETANPYFGKSMLSCGQVTETLSPKER